MLPVALLVQDSTADTIVPIGGVRRLDEKVKSLYDSFPDKYKFIEYDGRHYVSPKNPELFCPKCNLYCNI